MGDPVGQVPRMDVFAFPADKELAEKAIQANKKANPEIRTFIGRVASGDQFISKKEVKDRIVENFQAKCTEMEGAAIAHGITFRMLLSEQFQIRQTEQHRLTIRPLRSRQLHIV